MKIWLLSSEIPTYNPGGIARYVDNFARGLGARGHEVTVLSRADKASDERIAPGYRLVAFQHRWGRPGGSGEGSPAADPRFPFNVLDYWTALSFQYAEEVRELAAREGLPDVIEAQEYGAIAYYLQQRQLTEPGYLEGVPVVINAHSPDFILRRMNDEPAYQFPHYWTGRQEKACLHAADAVICPSVYLARQLREQLPGLAVESIPLPWTDLSDRPAPAEIDPDLVVYPGRLEVRKGVLRMLDGIETLWARGARFRLALVGGDCSFVARDTSVGTYLKNRYAHRLESGQLSILGARPHGETMDLMERARVVVIPSLWENWPNTCIEAMALGKLIVASEHGGQAEMIGRDEKAGLLFDWAQPEVFAQQLSRALSCGPEAAAAIGAEARRRVAGWCDPAVIIPRRVAHFQSVIEGMKPRSRFPFVNAHLRESAYRPVVDATAGEPGVVSVVVPCYEMAAYVGESVASALASDYPHLEVVIVDDGSRDEATRAELRRLETAHRGRVRVLRKPNEGLARARTSGALAARGAYLLFLDADDRIAPAFVGRAVRILERFDNVQIVFSWEQYFGASEDVFPGWNLEFPYLLAHNQTCPVTVVERAAWLAHGQNPPEFAYNFEDYAGLIQMVAAGCGGVCIHDLMTFYRIRRDGLWQGSSRAQQLFLYELLVEKFPALYREYGVELFALQNANGSAQTWLKPAGHSPYDERLAWEEKTLARLRARVAELEKRLAAGVGSGAE